MSKLYCTQEWGSECQSCFSRLSTLLIMLHVQNSLSQWSRSRDLFEKEIYGVNLSLLLLHVFFEHGFSNFFPLTPLKRDLSGWQQEILSPFFLPLHLSFFLSLQISLKIKIKRVPQRANCRLQFDLNEDTASHNLKIILWNQNYAETYENKTEKASIAPLEKKDTNIFFFVFLLCAQHSDLLFDLTIV